MFFKKVKVCTHDGKFHADDVFSVATLDLFFDGKIKVVRSRDQKIIDSADIVVDNGRAYDAEKKIFDHHQKGGAGERENGVPYAGFGLIWKHYGMALCEKFGAGEAEWKKIDEDFVSQIDAADNGYTNFFDAKLMQPAFGPDAAVKLFMTTWKESTSEIDGNFLKCARVAKEILKRMIVIEKDKVEGRKKVDEIYQNTTDKRVIILDQFYPWSHLSNYPEPILVLFPEVDTQRIMIQGVSVVKDSYDLRMQFPTEWRGLTDKKLEEASEIEGLAFCHNAGFLCVVRDIEVAKKVVERLIK